MWRSPTDHSFVFDDPRDERRYEKFGRDSDRLVARIPTRDPNEGLVHRLNQASRGFPPPIVWLAVGVIGLALRRPRHALVAVTPAAAGLTVIFASSLLVFAVPQIRCSGYSSVRAARCGWAFRATTGRSRCSR